MEMAAKARILVTDFLCKNRHDEYRAFVGRETLPPDLEFSWKLGCPRCRMSVGTKVLAFAAISILLWPAAYFVRT